MFLSDKYGPLVQVGLGDKTDYLGTRAESLARQRGAAFASLEHQRTWERAVVQEVYPDTHTCDVYTERGKYLAGVPWPDGGESVPKRGGFYAVHFGLGKPILVSAGTHTVVPGNVATTVKLTPAKNVGGDNPFYAGKGSGQQRGNAPKDVLPGDWVRLGDQGNLLAVLAGGTTILKASDLAQVIATQASHLLRLVGKNLKMDTGAGTLEFITENGKSDIRLYAGSDEPTESSPLAENFRIRCELGTDGELVDFRVTDSKGRSLYRIHVDPDGRVDQQSTRKTETIKEDRVTTVGTQEETMIGGDSFTSVGGSKLEQVGGSTTVDTGGHYRLYAAHNAALSAMHDFLVHAGRHFQVSATGDPSNTEPALAFDVTNGDVAFNVGDPTNGDTQSLNSGFKVDTATGDMAFKSLLGNFTVTTPSPNSVNLGGPVPDLFGTLVFEMYQAFMEVFGAMLDSHVHPVPALFGAPTAPPLVPIWSSSKHLFVASKSKYVKVGG